MCCCATKGDAIPRPVLCRNALFYSVSEPALFLRANATEKSCKKALEKMTLAERQDTENTRCLVRTTREHTKNAHPRIATFLGFQRNMATLLPLTWSHY